MPKQDTPTEPAARTTVSLAPELNRELNAVVTETGVSASDLFRQGVIRLLLERRETGHIRLLQLPSLSA